MAAAFEWDWGADWNSTAESIHERYKERHAFVGRELPYLRGLRVNFVVVVAPYPVSAQIHGFDILSNFSLVSEKLKPRGQLKHLDDIVSIETFGQVDVVHHSVKDFSSPLDDNLGILIAINQILLIRGMYFQNRRTSHRFLSFRWRR